MTIKQIIKKYNFKNVEKSDNWLDKIYTYKIYLPNLNTTWYINVEKSSIDKKLFNIFTRFDNYEILSKVNKQIECNTWSGKCNRYCFCLQQIENFINEVTTCQIL
jgi:hypothetical protein